MPDTGASFPKTRWTLLARAADRSTAECRAALDELIAAYWKPVYTFMRHRGIRGETARDLTQDYFAAFLEQEMFRRFDAEKGRFKTFVLATVKHFLSDQKRRAGAKKRGGGWSQADMQEIEALMDPREEPDTAFNRQWAESILEQAMQRLSEDEADLIRAYLSRDRRVTYADLAGDSGRSEADVRNALRRVRRRLRALILDILRADTGSERDVEIEMQELFLSI